CSTRRGSTSTTRPSCTMPSASSRRRTASGSSTCHTSGAISRRTRGRDGRPRRGPPGRMGAERMTTAVQSRVEPQVEVQLNPFLPIGPDRVYDPLTDRTLVVGEPGYGALRELLAGSAQLSTLADGERALLAGQGWLLPAGEDPARRFLLKYVALEAHTVCN